MTASAILSVPGTAAVSAAPSSGDAGVATGDAGAFGTLLQQQAQGQPQGTSQPPAQAQAASGLPLQDQLLEAALPSVPGGGEEASALPGVTPQTEAGVPTGEPTHSAGHPALSSDPAGEPVSGETPTAPEDEIQAALDAPVLSEAEIPEPVIADREVGETGGEAPPADDTVADAVNDTATPPSAQQQQAMAQPAAVAAAPSMTSASQAEPGKDEAVDVAASQPASARAHGRSNSAASARGQEQARGEGAAGANQPSSQGAAASTVAPTDAPILADGGDNGLSSPLLTQTLPQIDAKPAGSPYPSAGHAAAHQPIVKAEPGAMGGNVGTEIAKVAKAGRDDLLIRLDPRELGRVDVRLSFDHDGVLRAVLSADSPAALDMLRRESGDLNRALADAGVRADAQSLRFDARSGGQGFGAGSGETGQRGQQQGAPQSRGLADEGGHDLPDPIYRSLNASGHVDLMA